VFSAWHRVASHTSCFSNAPSLRTMAPHYEPSYMTSRTASFDNTLQDARDCKSYASPEIDISTNNLISFRRPTELSIMAQRLLGPHRMQSSSHVTKQRQSVRRVHLRQLFVAIFSVRLYSRCMVYADGVRMAAGQRMFVQSRRETCVVR
jgi:hypothetical protein